MDINESLRYLNIGLPEDILRKKMHGDFEGAIRMIDRRLQNPNLPEGMRQCMIAERHIMSISAEEYTAVRPSSNSTVRVPSSRSISDT